MACDRQKEALFRPWNMPHREERRPTAAYRLRRLGIHHPGNVYLMANMRSIAWRALAATSGSTSTRGVRSRSVSRSFSRVICFI